DSISPISQKFSAFEVFSGVGDSTKVFVELGYQFRVNDSVRNNLLQKVNSSNTYYLKSQLIHTDNTQLSALANYRTLKYEPYIDFGAATSTPMPPPIITKETERS